MPDQEQLQQLIADNSQGILAAVSQAGYPQMTNVLYVWDAIERMAPAEYLMTPYYVHWLHAAEDLLDKKGVVTHAELEQRMAELAKKGGK